MTDPTLLDKGKMIRSLTFFEANIFLFILVITKQSMKFNVKLNHSLLHLLIN